MQKNTEISERIIKLIDSLGVSKNEFAKSLNYKRSQSVYDICNGKSAPSFDFFNRLYNSEYSESFSHMWLFTGKGEMIGGIKHEAIPLNEAAEPNNNYGSDKIPLVSISAVAGFGNENFSITSEDVKEYYVIPKFKDRKIDFMIEVNGSSMYPKYNCGDVVACTIIRESNFIQWNKVHVIGTKEQGMLVKRIRKTDHENKLLLVSDNQEYEPFIIDRHEITGIALVVGVIRLV